MTNGRYTITLFCSILQTSRSGPLIFFPVSGEPDRTLGCRYCNFWRGPERVADREPAPPVRDDAECYEGLSHRKVSIRESPSCVRDIRQRRQHLHTQFNPRAD